VHFKLCLEIHVTVVLILTWVLVSGVFASQDLMICWAIRLQGGVSEYSSMRWTDVRP
jgi:hypothetical protein